MVQVLPGGTQKAQRSASLPIIFSQGSWLKPLERAQGVDVEVMMLTVDSITGGNRERDLRTGFSIPFPITGGGSWTGRAARSISSRDCGRRRRQNRRDD